MSIDNDEKFRELLGAYSEAVDQGYVQSEAAEERFIAARRDLIAYIDKKLAAKEAA